MSSCYLCGAPGTQLYVGLRDRMSSAPGEWGIRECHACGLAWLDPQPLPEMIPQLYSGYYTHQDSPSEGARGWTARFRLAVRRGVLATAFGYRQHVPPIFRLLGRLASLVPGARDTVGASIRWLPASRRGRVLDVGCGNGDFLAEMRSLAWDVAGIEPDPAAAEHTRTRGLTVECGTPENTQLPADSFDVITLNHVIEHVPDPIVTLKACGRLLRKEGLLVIVTPNVRSLGRRMFGASWMHWDPPRHFFLFTVETLRTCLARAGLSVDASRTPANGVRPAWGASRLIQNQERLSLEAYQRRPWQTRLEEWTWLFIESLSVELGQPAGEETVTFARRAGQG